VIDYPASLPCVSRAQGLNETAYAGVVRTPMEAGNARQRRMHRTLPHRLTLTWEMAQTELAAFVTWANAHAWDQWIALDLPGLLASREGVNVTATPVRFISDLEQELIAGQGLWYWRVRVEAEWQPVAAEDLAPLPLGDWIVADFSQQAQGWPAPGRVFSFTGSVFDPGVTFTRASVASYYDAAGVLQSAAVDAPRQDYDPATLAARGLLLEEARTNGIRNNTMAGGVAGSPGTIPTTWNFNATPTGLTRTLAFGVEDGVAYMDVRYAGTPTATGTTNIDFTAAASGVPAALAGQTWTGSVYVTRPAGTMGNVTVATTLFELSAALGGLVPYSSALTPAAGKLKLARVATTATLVNASTAFVLWRIGVTVTAGNAMDLTLRLGLPQIEPGAFATSPIQTASGPATRAADLASVTGANFSAWWRADEGSFVAAGRTADVTPAGLPRLFATLNGAGTDALQLARNNATAASRALSTVAGVAQVALDVGPMAGSARSSVVLAYRLNDYAMQADAGAVVRDTVALVPAADRLFLGAQGPSANWLNGWLESLTYYPARVPLGAVPGAATDWILAGTPASPSPASVTVSGGTPLAPSAYA
jgi:hypothetical protein